MIEAEHTGHEETEAKTVALESRADTARGAIELSDELLHLTVRHHNRHGLDDEPVRWWGINE